MKFKSKRVFNTGCPRKLPVSILRKNLGIFLQLFSNSKIICNLKKKVNILSHIAKK